MALEKERIDSLDSLRGIAAVTVIASHLSLEYFFNGNTPLKNTMLHIFYDGEAAVVFFFVLSGFVLSYKYLNSGSDEINKLSFRSFAISRLFRIYPLFWVALGLTALCAVWLPHDCKNIPERMWTVWWYNSHFEWSGFLKQATLVPFEAFLKLWMGEVKGDWYIPQAWSLYIELVLSVLVPVLILIAINRPKWLVFLTFMLVWVFGAHVYLIHFVMGILLAMYLPVISRYLQLQSKSFRTVLLFFGLFLYSYRYSMAANFPKVSVLQILLFSDYAVFTIIGLGVVIIIATVINSGRLKSVLGTPVMKLIGKVSYGIYLCHTIVLVFFTPVLIYWLNRAGVTNTALVLTAAFVITTTGTIIISFVLHHLVELPFIALGRKVNATLSGSNRKSEIKLNAAAVVNRDAQ